VFDLSLASPECAVETDNIWLIKWFLTVLLPVFFLLSFAVVYGAARLLMRFRPQATLTEPSLRDAIRRGYLQLLTLLYLPLTAAAASYFACTRRGDGKYSLDASPALVCYSTWYWNWFFVALVAIVGYGVGIPATIAFILRRGAASSEHGVLTGLFALRYAFLVGRFRERQYFFDVIIMARKVGVVVVLVLFRSFTLRANGAVAILMSCLVHLGIVMPYREPFHNGLALVCLASCALVLWGATFVSRPARLTVVYGALLVNVLAIVIGNVVDLLRIRRAEEEADKVWGPAADSEVAISPDSDVFALSVSNAVELEDLGSVSTESSFVIETVGDSTLNDSTGLFLSSTAPAPSPVSTAAPPSINIPHPPPPPPQE